MHQFKKIFFAFVIAISLSWVSITQALEINGVATLNQLGSEVFYGAILVQTPTDDADELLVTSQPMALEIKVISTISKRSWSSLWTQGVAINNSIDFFSSNADDFSRMLAAFKGPLAANDIVRIERINNTETRAVVNNVTLVEGLAPEVFLLCLRSWIGPVPFSGAFKEQVLGLSSSANQLVTYNNIKPLPARKSIVASWVDTGLAQQEHQQGVAQIQEQEPEVLAAAETAQNPEQAITLEEPEIFVEAPVVSAPGDISAIEEPTKAAGPDSKVTQTNVKETAEIALEMAAEAPAQEANEQPAPENFPEPTLAASAISTPEVGEVVAEDTEFSTESLIAQQRYIQSVRREIYAVIEYPLSAARRKLEGSVGLSITVNSNGDLVSAEIIEKSNFNPFNKAILRAAQSASPYPAFPKEMKLKNFTIATPFAFVLQR